jgi:arylsulfatase K
MLSESLDGRLLRAGSPARIPRIRALLAAGSVRFDSAYSNSPVCAPSRSSLHSGRDVHKIAHTHDGLAVAGVWNNAEGLDVGYDALLHDLLNASGYATRVFGKTDWTVGGHTETALLSSLSFNIDWPYNISDDGGWTEEDGQCASDGPVSPGGSGGAAGSQYANDWKLIADVSAFAASAPQPFYAFVGTSILHPPYQTNSYWFDIAAEQEVPAWQPLDASTMHPCDLQAIMKRGCAPGAGNASAFADFYSPARRARVRRVYLAELEEFDAMVGAVVDALVAAGRWNNGTMLVLAADHGDMQFERQLYYKMLPYDASARVPLVFMSPSLAPLGAHTVAQPAQLLDIFPTLLGLAGAPVPGYADGYSLAPFLAGAASDPSRPQFVASQNADEDISSAWFSVMNGTHKLVQYGTGAQVAPQLFDLEKDAAEAVNLFNTSDAARAAEAALDAQLRSLINYPVVGQAIADYQLALFTKWAALQTDWKKEIASGNVRWQQAFAAHPAKALAAAEAFLAQTPPASVRPCNGKLVNV